MSTHIKVTAPCKSMTWNQERRTFEYLETGAVLTGDIPAPIDPECITAPDQLVVGDQVMVHAMGTWYPGTVLGVRPKSGKLEVEYTSGTRAVRRKIVAPARLVPGGCGYMERTADHLAEAWAAGVWKALAAARLSLSEGIAKLNADIKANLESDNPRTIDAGKVMTDGPGRGGPQIKIPVSAEPAIDLEPILLNPGIIAIKELRLVVAAAEAKYNALPTGAAKGAAARVLGALQHRLAEATDEGRRTPHGAACLAAELAARGHHAAAAKMYDTASGLTIGHGQAARFDEMADGQRELARSAIAALPEAPAEVYAELDKLIGGA